jgi:hypothetical protein
MHPTVNSIFAHLDHWKKALMGPVVTIVVLIYQQSTGRPPTWGWFVAIIGSGLAWQFYSGMKKSQADLEMLKQDLERQSADSPRFKVVPNGFYADVRQQKETIGPVTRVRAEISCLHIKFKNDPEQSTENCIGKNILAELDFFDDGGHLLSTVRGRWGDTPEPPYLPPGASPAQALAMVDFGIGQERELNIAFKYLDEADCFAVSNEIYAYPDWKHPKQKLSVESLRTRVRLRGIGVDSSWDLWFKNPKNSPLIKIRQQRVGPAVTR